MLKINDRDVALSDVDDLAFRVLIDQMLTIPNAQWWAEQMKKHYLVVNADDESEQ